MENLETNCPNTWCPGCGNFGMLQSVKLAVSALMESGTRKEDIVIVTDIGCNSKLADYLDINSFYGLHGRSVATAEGIVLGNPNLKILVFLGDGAALDEGVAHLIHAAKRNSNINVILHNNRLFALTTGQFTAVSPKGFKGKSTPRGSVESPINPLELLMAANASFIGRSYSAKIDHFKNLLVRAVAHQGFSFIEVLQPCVSFFNTINFYNEKVYETESSDPSSREAALALIKEWNYNGEGKIPLGLFYEDAKETYEGEMIANASEIEKIDFQKCLEIHL